MPSNPTFGTPNYQAPAPVVADNRAILNAVDTAGRVGVQIAHDKVVDNFREDLNKAVDDAVSAQPDFQQIQNEYTGQDVSFKRKMDLIMAAERQGVMSAAQVLIEAEKVVRDAQARRPELAAEFQREAGLLLGTNPVGTSLRAAQAATDAWAGTFKAERERIEDIAYKPISEGGYGVPPDVPFGSAEFNARYQAGQQRQNLREATTNYNELHSAFSELQSDEIAIQAGNDLNREGGLLDAAATPILQYMDLLRGLDTQTRITVLNGESDNPSLEDIKAQVARLKLGLTQDLNSYSSPKVRERLAPQFEAANAYLDSLVEAISDPNRDLKAEQLRLQYRNARWINNLPLGAQQLSAEATFFKDITTYIASSPTSLNRPTVENIIGHFANGLQLFIPQLGENLPDRDPYDARTLRNNVAGGRSVDNVIRNDPTLAGSPNPEQIGLRDLQQSFSAIVNNTEFATKAAPDSVAAIVLGAASQTEYLNQMQNPADELVEQNITNITAPGFLQMAIRSDLPPTVKAQTAQSLRTFFDEQYRDYQTRLDGDMRSTLTRTVPKSYLSPGTTDNLRYADIVTIDMEGVQQDGSIKFAISPTAPVRPGQMRDLQRTLDRWSSSVTNYIRAQGTFSAMEAGLDTPDYVQAYNGLISGGVYGAPLPLADILPQVNVE